MEDPKNISKNNDYKVPEDYFTYLQERIQIQIEFEEIVGVKKGTGFIVPDGYFSNFSEKIVQQTQEPTKVISLFKNRWMYAVASVAAILLLVIILNPFSTTTPFDSLEDDVIASYLETNNSYLSVYDLGELLTDEELKTLSEEIQLEDTEVIDYLNTTTDPYDLMIQ